MCINQYLLKVLSFFLLLGYGMLCEKAAAQSESGPTAMSLQECIDYALKNNVDVKNAHLNIEIAQRKKQEVLAIGLPQISGNLTMNANVLRPYSFLPGEVIGEESGTFVAIQFSTPYTGNMTVDFEQMLFDGSFFVGLEASEAYSKVRQYGKAQTERDIVELTTKAYYLVLVNHSRERLVNKNFERLDSLLRNTQILYKSGFAEQIDVDRIRVQYNNVKVERDNFAKRLALSYALLKFQMGFEISRPLTLKDRIEDIQLDVIDESVENDFEYQSRVEYKLQEANIRLLEMDIKNVKSKYVPKFHLHGNYGRNVGTVSFDNLFKQWFGFGTVGLRLTVPIFDGLQKARSIQQKKIEVIQLQNSQSRLKQSIDLEIVQAKTALQKSVDNMKAQRNNMKLAERIYKASVMKYKEGIGSNTDVVDADSSLTEAEINYHVALYDALIAKTDLEKAYGRLYMSPVN